MFRALPDGTILHVVLLGVLEAEFEVPDTATGSDTAATHSSVDPSYTAFLWSKTLPVGGEHTGTIWPALLETTSQAPERRSLSVKHPPCQEILARDGVVDLCALS